MRETAARRAGPHFTSRAKVLRVASLSSLASLASLALLPLIASPAFVRAQTNEGSGITATDPRLARAQRYLKDGRSREALALFKSLVADYPNDAMVLLGLAQSAIGAGARDDARRVIEQQIAADPTNPDWIRLLGTLRKAEGKPQEALAAWRGLLTAIPDREEAYRITAGLAASEKMLTEAIAILHEGRTALGDSLLFSAELASLYDLTSSPEEALMEHARAVALGREIAAEAIAKSAEMSVGADEAARVAAKAFALPTAGPELRAELCDFVSSLWLAAGDCAAAREAAAEAGRASGDCGARELTFGERVADGACEAEALVALRSVVAGCPDSPAAWRARKTLSDRLVARGDYREARDILAAMVAGRAAGTCERSAALFSLGSVLLDGVREPAAARAAFEEHIATGRCAERTVWQARVGAAQAALLVGDAATAEKEFLDVIERAKDDATREAALFRLAELYFYSANFEKATENYRKLMATYPGGVFLNDVVARVVFLDQGDETGGGLLKEYADAQRAALAGDPGAGARLEAIVRDFPLSGLRDDAALDAALLAKWRGDFTGAVAALDIFGSEFAESPLAARALLEKAAIRADNLGDVAGGRADYERVLVDYPASLIADEARAAIEEIDARTRERTRG
ncbi:MAG: tetratricopeptide repeat protein [bacterium]